MNMNDIIAIIMADEGVTLHGDMRYTACSSALTCPSTRGQSTCTQESRHITKLPSEFCFQ